MHSVMSMNSAAITATTMKTTRAACPSLERMGARETVEFSVEREIRRELSKSNHFPDEELHVVDVSGVEDRIGARVVASPSGVVG